MPVIHYDYPIYREKKTGRKLPIFNPIQIHPTWIAWMLRRIDADISYSVSLPRPQQMPSPVLPLGSTTFIDVIPFSVFSMIEMVSRGVGPLFSQLHCWRRWLCIFQPSADRCSVSFFPAGLSARFSAGSGVFRALSDPCSARFIVHKKNPTLVNLRRQDKSVS